MNRITRQLSIVTVLICMVLLSACASNPYEEKIKQTLEYIFTLPIEGLAEQMESLPSGPPREITQDDKFVIDFYREKLEENIGDLFLDNGLQRLLSNIIGLGDIYHDINGVGFNRLDRTYENYSTSVDQIEIDQYDENTYYFTCIWIIMDGDDQKHQVEVKGRFQFSEDKISFFQLMGECIYTIENLS